MVLSSEIGKLFVESKLELLIELLLELLTALLESPELRIAGAPGRALNALTAQ